MKRRNSSFRSALFGILLLVATSPALAIDLIEKELPQNLAAMAKITASNEYSDEFKAQNVADGEIPDAGSRADQGRAWCVRGTIVGDRGELTLAWNKPVEIAELLLFSRSAYGLECWKDYDIVADGGAEVVISGSLQKTDLPQRIQLPKVLTVRTLTLRFKNAPRRTQPRALRTDGVRRIDH